MTELARNLEALETKAYREELLAAAFFIASAAAFGAGLAVFGWVMLAKAVIDTACALLAWRDLASLRSRAATEGQTDG